MRTAIILPIFGAFLLIGIATTTALNGRIDRAEDKSEQRLERIETKIDNQSEDIKDLSVAIGRIEEKLP